MDRPRPVLLAVLDGFGKAPDSPWNAVSRATTPTFDRLFARRPWTMVETSGERVGLPEGQMGNSEVGHTILGAGRVVYQDIVRISKSIRDGDFFTNPALLGACAAAEAGSGTLHFFGLLSHGGVHSLQEHLDALIDLAHRPACPASSSTPSSTGATRRRPRASGTSASFSRRSDGIRRPASARSSGATTPWTATSAGSGSRRPTAS